MAQNDTSTQASTRPETKTLTDTVSYSQDEQAKVTLIASMLDTAGNTVGRNKAPTKEKEALAYTQLHNSFRNLFLLRGQSFLDGFAAFVTAVNKYPEGIFYLPLVNKNLTDFSNAAERDTFLIFINMVVRFARASNKAGFAQINNVDRLTARVKDPELISLIRSAFLAA